MDGGVRRGQGETWRSGEGGRCSGWGGALAPAGPCALRGCSVASQMGPGNGVKAGQCSLTRDQGGRCRQWQAAAAAEASSMHVVLPGTPVDSPGIPPVAQPSVKGWHAHIGRR